MILSLEDMYSLLGHRQPVYIAGPMNGLPDFNYPAFRAMELRLQDRKIDYRSPTQGLPPPQTLTEEKPYEFFLRHALRLLLECESVLLLPGWRDSAGATLECEIAGKLDMMRWEYYDEAPIWLDRL